MPYAPPRVQATGMEDKTQALWPWYLKPFREPDVSPECRDFVLGEYEPADEEETRLLQSELYEADTVQSDINMSIVQQPGAASAVRQDYYAKGFRLVSPTTGEASGGPALQIWEPQMHSGYNVNGVQTEHYIGINEIIEDLSTRRKWALAQLQAKIDINTELARESENNKPYVRRIVAALRQRHSRVANGLPTAKELQLWFKQFELQRLHSRQDQRIREQQALQGRIDNQSQDIVRLQNEIQADWPA